MYPVYSIPPCCFLVVFCSGHNFWNLFFSVSRLCGSFQACARCAHQLFGRWSRRQEVPRATATPRGIVTVYTYTSSFRFFQRVPMRLTCIAGTPSPRNGGEIPKILRALRITLRNHGPWTVTWTVSRRSCTWPPRDASRC